MALAKSADRLQHVGRSKLAAVGLERDKVAPREIRGSTVKTLGYLGTSLAFVLIGILMRPVVWLGVAFFGACAVIAVVALIRPQRLLLDSEGFVVAGGFVRHPWRVRWDEIDGFFADEVTRSSKGVRFTFTAAASRRRGLAVGGLTQGWPGSVKALVADLNAYREAALAEGVALTHPSSLAKASNAPPSQ